MKRAEVEIEIRRINPLWILTVDPDAHQPGAAYTSLTRRDEHDACPCWVWGGNKGGEPLADPNAVARLLDALGPDLVIVEAALSSGGAFAGSMHAQNIVRGGWDWSCQRAGIPVLLIPPGVWQAPIAKARGAKGPGSRKPAYKAHARELVADGKPVNEDAAAALCMLDFALGTLGASVGKVTRGEP